MDYFTESYLQVRLVTNLNDKGPAHARSTGIRHARGQFIAFLDADDLWLRNKLSTQIDFMNRTGADFSYTKYFIMNSSGTEASCSLSVYSHYSYLSYLFLRGIGCSTVVVKSELFSDEILDSYGPWLGEDTLWWLMLLNSGVQACGVLEPLVLYRDSGGSLSKNRFKNQMSVWRIYRENLKISFPVALLAYLSYVFDVSIRRLRCYICTSVFGKKKIKEILV